MRQKGQIAVEFLLILPVFLFITFFIFEIGLMWIDRHFMNLAVFEAGRKLSIYSEMGDPCKNDEAMKSARIRAAFRMASVTDPMTAVLGELGVSTYSRPTSQSKDLNISKNGSKDLMNVLGYLWLRIPLAYALTDLECSFDSKKGLVRVKLIYFRRAKMPFVKNAMWAMYVLRELSLNGDSLEKFIGLDDNFFTLKMYKRNMVNSELLKDSVRMKVKEVVSQLVSSDDPEQQSIFIEAISAFGGSLVPDSVWENGLDSLFGADSDRILNDLGDNAKLMTHIVYSVPELLRLMPMEVVMDVRRFTFRNEYAEWEDGKAIGVAPFAPREGAEQWREWALQMSKTDPTF